MILGRKSSMGGSCRWLMGLMSGWRRNEHGGRPDRACDLTAPSFARATSIDFSPHLTGASETPRFQPHIRLAEARCKPREVDGSTMFSPLSTIAGTRSCGAVAAWSEGEAVGARSSAAAAIRRGIRRLSSHGLRYSQSFHALPLVDEGPTRRTAPSATSCTSGSRSGPSRQRCW